MIELKYCDKCIQMTNHKDSKCLKCAKKCNCEEMSCKVGCTKPHTHKGYSCEKCKSVDKSEKQYQEDIEVGVEVGETPPGYSKWVAQGKKWGYLDYLKDIIDADKKI